MNSKLIYFLLAATILVIISIFAINAMENAAEQKALAENKTKALAENRTKAQIEYIGYLQADSDRILSQDEDIKDLMNGTNHLCILRTIYNESYVEEVYRIGFNYENIDKKVYQNVGIEDFKGYRLVGGKIYKFSIDLSNETVTSIKEEDNFTSHDSVIDEVWIENSSNIVHSVSSIRGGTGGWISDANEWSYTFIISGIEDIMSLNDSSSAQVSEYFEHNIKIKKLYNKNQFYLGSLEGLPNGTKAWCDCDELPVIESKTEYESLCLDISYPEEKQKTLNQLSKAYFDYYWVVWTHPNQTVMFDVDPTFKRISHNKNIFKVAHNWLLILSSPPSPDMLTEDEMKEYGIWANYYGNYYSTNVTYVKKGDWLEDVTI